MSEAVTKSEVYETMSQELNKLIAMIERQNIKIDMFIERTVIMEQSIKDRPTLGCIKEFKQIVDEELLSRYEKFKAVHDDWHEKADGKVDRRTLSTIDKISKVSQTIATWIPYVVIIIYFIAEKL